MLIVAATFKGTIYDLNDKHYTVICKYDDQHLPSKIMFLSYLTLQYIIPSIVIIMISIALILTLSSTYKRTVDVQRDNGIKSISRALNRRATIIVIIIMFAFVIPYSLYFAQVSYHMVTKANGSFETNFIIRYGSGLLAYSNGAINVIIYLVKMRDFRAFFKKTFISMFFSWNSNSVGVNVVEIQMQRLNFRDIPLKSQGIHLQQNLP